MLILMKINNFWSFIKNMLGIKNEYLYGAVEDSRRLKKTMNNINLNDVDNIKILYERITGDNKNLKVTILWKQDSSLEYSKNISVYAEIFGEKRDSIPLSKVENTDLWVGELRIMKLYSELYNFEKKLAIKLVECKVIPYKKSLQFAY